MTCPPGDSNPVVADRMIWRLCLGLTDHWVIGEGDGSCLPGRLYPTACGDSVYVIGFAGVDRRCGKCRRLSSIQPRTALPRRDPGLVLSLLRLGWPRE